MENYTVDYYRNELADWKRTAAYYDSESISLGERLAAVIRRNNIPGIAYKVEEQQGKIDAASERFLNLEEQVSNQEKMLVKNSLVTEHNAALSVDVEKKQNELRKAMQLAEKAFLETKYACLDFLSQVLKKNTN